MTQRWWYLRHSLPWPAVLTACAAAGLLAGCLARWPSTAVVLLPALLACCATAAAFLFDEAAVRVVAVTPRGATWRRTTRLAVAALPLGLWALVVLARPGDLPLERSGWWLVGGAVIALTVGVAALASRREVPAPSALLAGVVALAAIGPVVITSFLGWPSIYPIGDFSAGVLVFWLVVAAAAAATLALTLRRGVRA